MTSRPTLSMATLIPSDYHPADGWIARIGPHAAAQSIAPAPPRYWNRLGTASAGAVPAIGT
jgi:hypothetical protein